MQSGQEPFVLRYRCFEAHAPVVPVNFMEGRLTPPGEPRMAGAKAKTDRKSVV